MTGSRSSIDRQSSRSPSFGWRKVLRETRTRILLLYLFLMLIITGASVPVFRWLLFQEIDNRVREDLREEMAGFQEGFLAWEESPEQDIDDLKRYIDRFLNEERPEDDNFFITILDGQFYRSSPAVLLESLRPDSEMVNRWSGLTKPKVGERDTDDPETGKVIYLVQPLMVDGRIKGVFVTAHASAGEQQEALAGVRIFAAVAIAVVLIAFALAWVFTGHLFAPVRKLTATAQAIVSESDLDRRISKVSGQGELAQLAEVFNRMMDRIQAAFDSQRNFINDAGHELRTPITIIQGHLEVMGDDPEEQRETLVLVRDELERMNRFVNDLIMLAKAEGPNFIQVKPVEVAVLIDDLYSKVTTLADRKWHLVNRCNVSILGDRQRLMGALLNLVNNAIQHTQPHDLIELGATSHSDEVRFWVRDTGTGISFEDQQRIFDRFARAANSYRRSEGVGLGLAIVKAIVEAHQGRIELVSQVGAGSTFSIIVPIAPATKA